jgi:hypothetical protein
MREAHGDDHEEGNEEKDPNHQRRKYQQSLALLLHWRLGYTIHICD